MDEHELAWAAGFFDGDGWVALVRDRGRRTAPMAQINQAGPDGVPEVLIRFRDAVGVGHIGGPKRKKGRQDLYWWVSRSRCDIRAVGTQLVPWLSAEKRGQFQRTVGLRIDSEPIDNVPWAAGLFDAEGSTSLSDHRSHAGYKYVEASVTQGGTLPPPELIRFAAVTGVGTVYGPYRQDGANELVYRWRLQRSCQVREVIARLDPWLGVVKRDQARMCFVVIDAQLPLLRGRVEWGSHKTHCIHGHEYATARVRPYRSRGGGVERRASKQCLVCSREQARARREAKKMIGDPKAADHDAADGDATC